MIACEIAALVQYALDRGLILSLIHISEPTRL